MKRTYTTGANGTTILLLFTILISACNSSQTNQAQNQTPELKILNLTPRTIELHSDFPARMEGIENIEIRPKVEGFIEQVLIDEGEAVKKGQLLFVLDAPQYEQEVINAEAAVLSATADVNTAQVNVDKARPLVKRGIISEYELTSAENTLQTMKAGLAQAQANLRNAKTNLQYTKITSPVSGVVGTLPYKLGSLVSNTTNPLTTISNIDKVYAYFSVNERSLLNFFRNTEGRTTQDQIKNLPDVELILADDSKYDFKGRIETISGQVDEETGSFNVRAKFENPRGLLRTGNSATLRIPSLHEEAIVIPQAATYDTQGSIFVYKYNSDSTAQSKKIEVANTPSGKAYVVSEGLSSGDQIIVESINTLSNGTKVKPVIVDFIDIEALQVDTYPSSK